MADLQSGIMVNTRFNGSRKKRVPASKVCCAVFISILLMTTSLLAGPQKPAQTSAGENKSSQKPNAPPSGSVAASRAFAPAPFREKVVREGIEIDFSLEFLHPPERPSPKLREGDDVVFRFRVTDAATGTPLRGAYPAAWMDLHPEGEKSTPETCRKKVQNFIGGSIFSKAELDLNAYYVVTLNADATLSVVDPLFGFGGSKLLAFITLQSYGYDWALTEDQTRLFVSMPEASRVAVIETASWKVSANLDAGPRPARLALQPDEHYLWVTNDDSEAPGVTVLTTASLEVAARIPTGRGRHEIAFSDDSQLAFITNSEEGTLSVIDIRELKKIKDIETGKNPVSIAFSPAARSVYVAHEGDGQIVALDASRQRIVARIKAEPGLAQIRFAPGRRIGFAVNPEKDLIHVIDAPTNRIVQTGELGDGPDQVAFTDKLAYVRHRGSEIVLMISLDEIGVEGRPVQVVDFPGGESPPGKMTRPTPADGIVRAPGADAVLIANPTDKAVYFYKEGMAAPMGNFSNYNREARAVMVVDRSLKARSSPGVYETVARLRRPGIYDVVFFLDTPRLAHCFEVKVDADAALAQERRATQQVKIRPLIASRTIQAGKNARLQFQLTDPNTSAPQTGLDDVNILIYMPPGWHKRYRAEAMSEGVYRIDFVPPQPGVYYVYVECQSLGLTFNNPQYLVLEATAEKKAEK
ncbi:MAG: YncE family protein [Blastocatellia bacterium]|nr:YncE family protein [Blastocatellia bacterium]